MAAPRPSSVQYFAPDHPRLTITVRAKLEKRRGDLLEQLLMPLTTDDYNRRAGIIRGIDEAIQCCVETEDELKERG